MIIENVCPHSQPASFVKVRKSGSGTLICTSVECKECFGAVVGNFMLLDTIFTYASIHHGLYSQSLLSFIDGEIRKGWLEVFEEMKKNKGK